MSPDQSLNKLIYMANQISKFFVSQGRDQAVAATADHLRKFWDPHMRETLVKHVASGGSGLEPCARDAVEQLRATMPAADAR